MDNRQTDRPDTLVLQYEEMRATFEAILLNAGIPQKNAALVAGVIAGSTIDGILSHGIRRFVPLVTGLREGNVTLDPAELISSFGAVELWDAKLGIGVVNATHATARAIALATEHGVGCVGLKNNTHWLRGGSYGWQAVEAGCALLCWTNTISNMPGWGETKNTVGNNPLVIAVPGERPIVLDMAMSQFSMGALHLAAERGETLPIPGGYDSDGALSTDPGRIIESGRALPAGFWKGSALAVVLDALAVLLSGGKSTGDHDAEGAERGVSQSFIAIDPSHTIGREIARERIGEIVSSLSGTRAAPPGTRTLERRERALREGVEIEKALWEQIRSLRT